MILDACVLIAALSPEDAHHDVAHTLLATAEPLATPPLTMTEVIVGPARTGQLGPVQFLLTGLGIELAPGLDPAALATLRADTGMPLPDCVVLDAARGSGQMLATFDERLARHARALGVTVVP
ncbi:MAG: PIN domain-containing protein [Actinobacteria bacterium]|nr:PIN domain-containing protein [Actinomycetota bacterium]